MSTPEVNTVLLPIDRESADLMVRMAHQVNGANTAEIRYDGEDPLQIDPGVAAYGDFAEGLKDRWADPDNLIRGDFEALAARTLKNGGVILELAARREPFAPEVVDGWLNNQIMAR